MTPIPKAKWSHFLWMKVVIWQKSWNVFAFAPVAGYFNSTRTQQDSESCKLITYLGPCACKSHRSCPTLYPLESKIACQSSLPADKKGITLLETKQKQKISASQKLPRAALTPRNRFQTLPILRGVWGGSPSLQVSNCHLVLSQLFHFIHCSLLKAYTSLMNKNYLDSFS